MATGVLVAGIERGTKLLAHLVAQDKTYMATIRLGAATTTDDREGDVVFSAATHAVDNSDLTAVISTLTGDILQVPASVSAIKIDGRRAHERIRAGEKVALAPRPVTVYSFAVIETRRTGDYLDVDVSVHCSSGTYIRALARDLGAALGVGGHLIALRRTSVGHYTLADAHTLEDVEAAPSLSMTIDEALTRTWPVLPVTAAEYDALAMGKWLAPRGLDGVHAAQGPDGKVVALIKEEGNRLATTFVARPSTLQ